MVNRANQNIAKEIDKLNDNESIAVLNYISELLSTRLPKSKENPFQDDLIVSLQDAYENKRARQVFEWERTRRRNFYNAV
ncbi:MAG TPA: hypothetical protein VK892_20545 [Pyrinomonadaceae bacterium]|nr:hypothetical protein [Pyrinomonadaceae bacterium]